MLKNYRVFTGTKLAPTGKVFVHRSRRKVRNTSNGKTEQPKKSPTVEKVLQSVPTKKSRPNQATMGSVKLDELRKTLEDLLESKLKEQREALVRDLGEELGKIQATVRELDTRMSAIESYTRRNNVVVHGVPVQEGEDPLVLTERLGELIGVPLNPADIDIAHRLPTRNPKLPPPFIIKIMHRWRKERVLRAAKEKKPTAESFGGDKKTRIFFNDHLTPRAQQLFSHARKLSKDYFVWVKNDTVLCRRRKQDAHPIVLLDKDDVDFVEESKEENLNGVLYKQPGKRGRGSSSNECSPEIAGARPLKKAVKSLSQRAAVHTVAHASNNGQVTGGK